MNEAAKMKIWKYPIPLVERYSENMPGGAEILTAQMQRGAITLWAIVDGAAPLKTRHFRIVGTGNEMPACALRYIATVQDAGYVWHIFEEIK